MDPLIHPPHSLVFVAHSDFLLVQAGREVSKQEKPQLLHLPIYFSGSFKYGRETLQVAIPNEAKDIFVLCFCRLTAERW